MISIERKALPCKKSCLFVSDNLHPCGEGFNRKETPCFEEINKKMDQIDAEKPDLPVSFVDAEKNYWHITTIFLRKEDGSIEPIANVVNGEFIPIPSPLTSSSQSLG